MAVCVLGSINYDNVASVKALPRPGETTLATQLEQFTGGKGANQAVAAARQGAPTRIFGAIGDDGPGHEMVRYMAAAGVDTTGVKVCTDYPSGQAFVAVSETGENSIIVALGANTAISAADADAIDLTGVTAVLSQLECPQDAVAAFFARAGAAGIKRILNAAPARPEAAALFPLTDILIVNEPELATYAGLASVPDSVEDIERAAQTLRSRPDQAVVATLGARGALLVGPAGSILIEGRRLAVVDTVGAGDCFCGALAAALDKGHRLADAALWANAAAGLSVTVKGAAASMPDAGAVRALLDQAAR